MNLVHIPEKIGYIFNTHKLAMKSATYGILFCKSPGGWSVYVDDGLGHIIAQTFLPWPDPPAYAQAHELLESILNIAINPKLKN